MARRPADLATVIPILLNARGAQPLKTMFVDRSLPAQEFLDAQSVPGAGFFKREYATAHGGNHKDLSTHNPTCVFRRWKIVNRKRAKVRTDHVFSPRPLRLCHRHTLINNSHSIGTSGGAEIVVEETKQDEE